MPNHIQNRLKFTCSPERLEEVLEAIKYEDDGENRDVGRGTIDFNKLIPMRDSSYAEIWNSFLCFCDNEGEEALLSALVESSALGSKKKPYMNGSLCNPATQETYPCDLIWRDEKLIFLTAENEDLKATITNGGWTCICSTDADITVEKIIEMIPEA